MGDAGEEENLSEEELMEVFDKIDVDHLGHINQDQLLETLTSRDVEVRRKRKSIVSMAHAIFNEQDRVGDWKVSRDDWRRLVHETTGNTSLCAKSLPPSMLGGGAPNDLRRASIAQLERSGLRASVPWNYTVPASLNCT
uniref:EF-hand domain-containing protein n=1 Tax=Odontella aurita TaxID=265563 RepID=A0A6U6F587_9STRA|mmetsp:Transcript_32243/g.96679  ORF Transcript_32243/g.96679 Transcript_32243/m.96679 type:complete len:139 (+) Transcript_32243:606-1022(+)